MYPTAEAAQCNQLVGNAGRAALAECALAHCDRGRFLMTRPPTRAGLPTNEVNGDEAETHESGNRAGAGKP